MYSIIKTYQLAPNCHAWICQRGVLVTGGSGYPTDAQARGGAISFIMSLAPGPASIAADPQT